MKYRGRIEIMHAILRTAMAGATKTRIMYIAYLSYAQVKEYLEFLQEKDLLVYEQGEGIYRVTEKAAKFLTAVQEIDELLPPKKPRDDLYFGI